MGKKTILAAKRLGIRLLGTPEVSFEGRPLLLGRKKALALLCYLAAEGGKHPRRELAEFLWPNSEERHARTDLRSILSKLRKALEENGAGGEACDAGSIEEVRLLAVDGDLLWLEQRGFELDIRTLKEAVELARGETSGNPSGDGHVGDAAERRDPIARLEEALRVHRGEFMEGFSLKDTPEFELWLEAERARWRALFGELCERVSRLQAGAGRPEEATGTSRLWASHAPLEEAAHRRLMELLSSTGDTEGALQAYEGFQSALGRELEIKPSPQMAKLAKRFREEMEQRASVGASLTHSASSASSPALEVPFAGRGDEFGALVSEYRATIAGETRLVAVLGEAGIGKTRLVEEVLGWAGGREAEILKGAASEGAGLPYGPLIEAIRPRIERERAPDDLLEDAWLSELSRLLPELKERYPDLPPAPSGGGETAKAGLFEAIARTVGVLASMSGPVVLFLDDLHWADDVTLEVLDYAGRRWAQQGAPVLVLAAARPEEAGGGSGFNRWLSSLERRLTVRRLILGPLENEDVERMLRKLAGVGIGPATAPETPGTGDGPRSELERLGEWLAAETGGQPFFLVETLKALLEEEKLVVRAGPEGGGILETSPALRVGGDPDSLVPQSVRGVIMSRLSRLSPAASDLLAAGAVLGRGFGFELLVAVAGLEETEGLRSLDELAERRILREDGDGRGKSSQLEHGVTYSFSHEKIRQVAYTEGGRTRRRVLHRRAFGVLETGGAPPAQLARHALAGGLAREAFKYSLAAGDAAAEVFAVSDAIGHYERAREVLDSRQRSGGLESSVADIGHLYAQLGRAYEMTDGWEKARAAYETMLALAREAREARLEVASLNLLAVFLFQHEGDLSKAGALLEAAREVAREAGLAEALVETECNLADVMGLWTGDFERSWPLAEKALVSARALERPHLVARALGTLARLKTFAGRLEEAAEYAEEGATLNRELAERATDARTELPTMLIGVTGLSASWRAGNKATQIQCLVYLAYVRIFQGRTQEGMAIAREVRTLSEELPERIEMLSLWALGMGLLEAGDYEEALALARRGADRSREARDTFSLAANLSRLGDAHMALQNMEEARAAYEEVAEYQHYGPFSHARLCVVAALSGDWEDARAYAKRAHEVGTFFNPMFVLLLHHGIEALLRGGDEGLAREEIRRLAGPARLNERDRIPYLRSLAVLRLWEGDTGRAMGPLRAAEALTEKIGLPSELWQVQSKIAELHQRRGETVEAQEAYSRAAQTIYELAGKIKDKKLREGFLAAPRVRRVLGHD